MFSNINGLTRSSRGRAVAGEGGRAAARLLAAFVVIGLVFAAVEAASSRPATGAALHSLEVTHAPS